MPVQRSTRSRALREANRGSGRLLERDEELDAVAELLEEARCGQGRLVVIEGPAGIGKTRLLEAAAARARVDHMLVLTARGLELEREFSFGLVRQLFEGHMKALGAAEQETMLSGAARLASRSLGLEDVVHGPLAGATSLPGDVSFALLHGLYWLTSSLSERGPILLVADDVHWADAGSLRFFAFLAPRLAQLPVLLALAARSLEPGVETELVARLRSDARTRVIRLAPLSAAAAAVCLRDAFDSEPDEAFSRACHEATGGNPFLLRELVATLLADGIRPTAEAVRQIKAVAPESVVHAVLTRLARLGDAALALARAVAVLGDGAQLARAAELAGLPPQDAVAAADALVQADLFALGGPREPLAFAHPLLRGAVDSDLQEHARAAAHDRAARLLDRDGASRDDVAVHLLASEPAGDPWVAAMLREAALPALGRGAADVAVAYLERALAEPPPWHMRPEVSLQLGLAQIRAADTAGIERLRALLDKTHDPAVLATATPPLARALMAAGRTREGVSLLQRAIGAAKDRESRLELEAELIAIAEFDTSTAAIAGDRLVSLAKDIVGESPAERLLLGTVALKKGQAGECSAQAAADLAERALAGGQLLAERTCDSLPLWHAIRVLMVADQLEAAEEHLAAAVADARARGSVVFFAIASALRSRCAYLRGEIPKAEEEAQVAVDAARLHEMVFAVPHAFAYLADALLEHGTLDSAEKKLGEAGLCAEVPDNQLYNIVLFSRGRLRLAQGRIPEGTDDLLEVGRRQAFALPFDTPWASSLAPALAASGERDEALRLAEDELRQAHIWATPRGKGRALHALGLVKRGEPALDFLGRAVAAFADSPAVLEHARALTDLGAALRRANQRAHAREVLREALDLAHRCGATALAERSRFELAATGAKPRRAVLHGLDALTASERRVAEMAAQGMPNRHIAQALFVTEKTVETHLSRTYRKLAIGSRRELRGVAGLEEPAGDAGAASRLNGDVAGSVRAAP